MPSRGHGVTDKVVFQMAGAAENYTGTVPGVECFRWTVPDKPHSEGIIIRSVEGFVKNRVGSGGPWAVFDIQKGTTSLVTAVASTSTTGSLSLTLVSSATALCEAGDVITVDITAGAAAATWSASSAFGGITIALNYDWLGDHTGGGVR